MCVKLEDPGTKRYKFPQLSNDFSLSLTKAMSSVRYFWCLDWCQPARHPSLNIAASEACGLPMGVLVGSSVRWSELSSRLHKNKQPTPALRPRWEPRIFILISSLTGEDLLTKSSLMASASGPRLRWVFLFFGVEKNLWKKCLFWCEWFAQVMDANSFLCEGGILHRERIFGLNFKLRELAASWKNLGAKIACKRCDVILRHPTGYQGNWVFCDGLAGNGRIGHLHEEGPACFLKAFWVGSFEISCLAKVRPNEISVAPCSQGFEISLIWNLVCQMQGRFKLPTGFDCSNWESPWIGVEYRVSVIETDLWHLVQFVQCTQSTAQGAMDLGFRFCSLFGTRNREILHQTLNSYDLIVLDWHFLRSLQSWSQV